MIASSTAPRPAPRFRAARLTVGALALAALLSLVGWSLLRPTQLPGTDLGGRTAPDFRLLDYRGVEHGLVALRGRPVVLAFLYAGCRDVCRLTTAGLAETARELGPDADRVAFVGVSVDPAGDDASAVRRFLTRQGVGDRLVYLTGPGDRLRRVWDAYYVDAEPEAHTDAVYLIDRRGRQRALLRSDFDPSELAAALRALQREWL
ncbi:MAG TPA: SCO family protein [Chloroflexota bacterium]|nr:SCO family protein [Chloroflexota bacterium]